MYKQGYVSSLNLFRHSNPLRIVSRGKKIDFSDQHLLSRPSKVPEQPITRLDLVKKAEFEIPVDIVHLLEKLSLVDINDRKALEVLRDSIEFASQITQIDTEGVEPMYTVLERENLQLRDDSVTEGNIRSDILRNAALTEEEYFVVPPGNIVVEKDTKKLN